MYDCVLYMGARCFFVAVPASGAQSGRARPASGLRGARPAGAARGRGRARARGEGVSRASRSGPVTSARVAHWHVAVASPSVHVHCTHMSHMTMSHMACFGT